MPRLLTTVFYQRLNILNLVLLILMILGWNLVVLMLSQQRIMHLEWNVV